MQIHYLQKQLQTPVEIAYRILFKAQFVSI